MEGDRLGEVRRNGLLSGLIADGSFAGTESSRPVKFPISASEARNNSEMADDSSQRCLPKVS